MKQSLSSLFLLIFAFSFSQIQLKVISSKNQKPIYNASVYCDDNRYMAAFFRQVKIGVLTLTLEKKQ